MKANPCPTTKQRSTGHSPAGLSAALAALAVTAADAQVIINNTEHTITDFSVAFGWDPLDNSSYANNDISGDGPLVFYGCMGFMEYASSGVGIGGYESVQFGGPVSLGSNIANVASWTDESLAGQWIGSAGEIGNTLPEGTDLFIAFRFRQTGETLFNHGYGHFILNGPDQNDIMLATMKGFAWESTPGAGLTVNAIPEASVVSLLSVAGFFLWWFRSKLFRSRA